MQQYVLSVLVDNSIGVLGRVTGLFSRRGYNIKSLNVAETENPELSRMTIVTEGDSRTIEQIEKQLLKLYDVSEVKILHDAVCREHILIRAGNSPSSRQPIIEIANLFRAKVVNVGEDSLMLELTGEPEKINSFIGLLRPFKIDKIVRTGICALERD
ncbi:MAG: acetolactate synthase small subunit [Eubacterium sp.]|nr:acetolactate synthase small subunit [Eubacterium sp.]